MKHFLTFAFAVVAFWGVAVAATPGDVHVQARWTAVQCNTTATALPASPMTGRNTLLVQNKGAGSIYVGDVNVTAANGIEVIAGGSMSADLGYSISNALSKLYCIAPGGLQVTPADTRVLEVR